MSPFDTIYTATTRQLIVLDRIIWGFLTQFPIKDSSKLPVFQKLLQKLRAHEQRQFLFSFLDTLSNRALSVAQLRDRDIQGTPKSIASSIALLQAVISSSDAFKESLVAWLTIPASGSASASFATRRVVVASLQTDEGTLILYVCHSTTALNIKQTECAKSWKEAWNNLGMSCSSNTPQSCSKKVFSMDCQ